MQGVLVCVFCPCEEGPSKYWAKGVNSHFFFNLRVTQHSTMKKFDRKK